MENNDEIIEQKRYQQIKQKIEKKFADSLSVEDLEKRTQFYKTFNELIHFVELYNPTIKTPCDLSIEEITLFYIDQLNVLIDYMLSFDQDDMGKIFIIREIEETDCVFRLNYYFNMFFQICNCFFTKSGFVDPKEVLILTDI